MGRAFGIVALIFGIISIPVGGIISPLAQSFGNLQFGIIISILGWVCIVVAILFGIIGFIVDESKRMAIAGLILGIVGLIVSLIFRFAIFFRSIFIL